MPTSIPSLTTERLILRPFTEADAADVERLAGAWEVADTTLNIPHPYPEGAAVVWMGTHDAAWTAGTGLTLAIALRATPDRIIGGISLSVLPEHSRGELGYWIATDHWGSGYATEAARAMMAFGFADLRLHRIQARHFTRNPASGRVIQKLGMRFEGVNRGAYFRWGRFEDAAVYAILAEEWQTRL